MAWHNSISPIEPRGYTCSYCGKHTGPNTGFFTKGGAPQRFIYLCTFCDKPTFFDGDQKQYPGAPFGNPVASLPKDVEALYIEARSAMTVNSFTSVVLTCRKILMHIAVEKGAPEGQTFKQYVQHLADEGYVPPGGEGWVDHIRDKGNDANHEIILMSQPDAGQLMAFLEMLLKFVYEFPALVPAPPIPAPARP
jgi:hypothetical protein